MRALEAAYQAQMAQTNAHVAETNDRINLLVEYMQKAGLPIPATSPAAIRRLN